MKRREEMEEIFEEMKEEIENKVEIEGSCSW